MTMKSINTNSIRNNYLFSCYKDVELIKPGNVFETSPHNDMNAEHFKMSAELSVGSICNENFSLGDRIYKSIQRGFKTRRKYLWNSGRNNSLNNRYRNTLR